MAEYIQRDDTREAVWRILEGIGISSKYNERLVEEVDAVLDDIPAADVRPVVRGKWVKAQGSWCTPGGDPVWECSVCGKGRHVYGIEHGSYGADVADGQWVACPNCGADMREES